MRGYLEFYRKTREVVKVPFIVLALGFIPISLLFIYLPPGHTIDNVRPINFLQFFYTIELILIVLASLLYLKDVYVHNKSKSQPDASLELQSFGGAKSTEEIIDRQSEQIRYLKQKISDLSKTLIRMPVDDFEIASIGNQNSFTVQPSSHVEQQSLHNATVDNSVFEQLADQNRDLLRENTELTEKIIKFQTLFEAQKDGFEEAVEKVEQLERRLAELTK